MFGPRRRTTERWRCAAILFFAVTAILFSDAPCVFSNQYDFHIDDDVASGQLKAMENPLLLSQSITDEDVKTKEPDQSKPEQEKVPSIKEYAKEFPGDLVGGTKRIFTKDNMPLALIGAGLTVLAFTVDESVKDYFQNRKPLGSVSHYGDVFGQGYYQVAIGATFFVGGELTDNRKLTDTGAATLEALLVTGIATEALKYATERVRPNGHDSMSFPSGHVSVTASMAASISEMYDWDLRISIPLYLATAFVGASRIQDNMHYLSDVIAGATLGTIVGMSFARYHKEKSGQAGQSEQKISITPLFDKDIKGLVFTLRF